MRALIVIKVKPLLQSFSQLGAVVKRPQIKILILERPPQSLDENIVLDSAAAVHADVYIMLLQQTCKRIAGELSPLIGIEDFRHSKAADGIFNGPDTKIGIQAYWTPARIKSCGCTSP